MGSRRDRRGVFGVAQRLQGGAFSGESELVKEPAQQGGVLLGESRPVQSQDAVAVEFDTVGGALGVVQADLSGGGLDLPPDRGAAQDRDAVEVEGAAQRTDGVCQSRRGSDQLSGQPSQVGCFGICARHPDTLPAEQIDKSADGDRHSREGDQGDQIHHTRDLEAVQGRRVKVVRSQERHAGGQ